MRALLLVVGGLGVGTPEAEGDTFGDLRRHAPGLALPTLLQLGLEEAAQGNVFDPPAHPRAASYGRLRLASGTPDTAAALWELAGVVTTEPFLPSGALPGELLATLEAEAGVRFLGDGSAPLEAMIARHGREHLLSAAPLLCTAPGSVLVLAAHRSALSSQELFRLTRTLRHLLDPLRLRLVVGHSLEGEWGHWVKGESLELPLVPPRTLLNALSEVGLPVEAVGGVGGYFSQSGVTRSHLTGSARQTLPLVSELWGGLERGLIFARLTTPGGPYGDPEGYRAMLEALDRWLGPFREALEPDDLLILTGDHGQTPGEGGARQEELPVLLCYDGQVGPFGVRPSLADVAATLAAFFNLPEEETATIGGTPLLPFRHPGGFAIP